MKTARLYAAKALLPVAAALAAFSNPAAHAESTYGYNAAGTGPVTATAKLNLKVNVPLLILLRVGSSGTTVDELVLTVAPTSGIPGGETTLTDGNNQATEWTGVAPVMAGTSSPTNVTAYAWTNSVGGGSVNFAFSTAFSTGGLSGASIDVASAPAGGTPGLAHPGTNMGTPAATSFAANTLVSSTWTYSLTSGALAAVTAGEHTAEVTYTATSL